MGEIEVPQGHVLLKRNERFRMSGYFQELCCHSGQAMVFEEASAFMEKYLLLTVSGKQIERVCHYYGEQIEEGNPPASGASVRLCLLSLSVRSFV